MKLHLGVNEMAYSDPEEHQATTTGQVAEILEDKYQIMEVFFDNHREEIEDLVVDRFMGELESVIHGKPKAPLSGMTFPKIDREFRSFLDRDEWQQLTGKRIMSAVLGISHRKKLKKVQGSRPAFIDTGLYQKSFTAWLE